MNILSLIMEINMKKAVPLFLFATVLAAGASGQVPAPVVGKMLCYSFTEEINTSTGVREAVPNDWNWKKCLTFTSHSCYQVINRERWTYQFLKEENGMYVFLSQDTGSTGIFQYLYFSKDFRRFNSRFYLNNAIQTGWSAIIDVYNQTKP
jgi:hypothetical protein